jgi:Arabinose efflux permease
MLPAVFANKNFALLLSGRLVSQLGDRVYSIAVAMLILEKTGSAAAMGIVMAASILPGIVLGLFAGPFVDRWDRKSVLVGADIVRALVVGAMAALQAADRLDVGLLIASAIVLSSASAFFDPAAQAIVPSIVGREELPRANSLGQFVGGLTTVAGPAAGGLAVASLGFGWAIAANAISYLLSALLEAAMRGTGSAGAQPGSGFVEELREGLRFLSSRRDVVSIISTIALAHFFVGALSVGLPVLARSLGGEGARDLGLLQAAMGVGTIGGALISAASRRGGLKESGLYVVLVAFGCAVAALGLGSALELRTLLPYEALMLAAGALVARASVFWQSLLQRASPEELAGRVFSVSNLAGNGALPLAYALCGFLLSRIPLGPFFIAAGCALCLCAAAMAARSRRGGADE